MFPGIIQYLAIRGCIQPDIGDMIGMRKDIRQCRDEGGCEILVKQELQAFTASW